MSDTDGSGDTHKRSKSILKNKADARLGSDPESERLLSDTGSGVSDISVIPVSIVIEGIDDNLFQLIQCEL